MMRVLAVVTKAGGEIVEYVVLEDRRYPTVEAFLDAARREAQALSEESFFRMFPNLKLTPRSVRSQPGGAGP
ncbi:MAG: hypothetical protein ACUVYA_01610 [Planctomycetota bacterium]